MHRRTFIGLLTGASVALAADVTLAQERSVAEEETTPPPLPPADGEGQRCAWSRSFAPLITDVDGQSVW